MRYISEQGMRRWAVRGLYCVGLLVVAAVIKAAWMLLTW